MRIVLITFSLFVSALSFGQKNYQIDKVFWKYEKPTNYKIRIDNFSSAMKAGDSLLKQNYKLQKQTNDDVILFSVAKSDSSNLNVILGSYKGNTNIAKFTLKGYVEKLVELFKDNYQRLKSDVQVTTQETYIDKVHFFIIESKNNEKNFVYWTRLYIAEVSGKELEIAVTYDNETDRKAIETSILNLRFVSS